MRRAGYQRRKRIRVLTKWPHHYAPRGLRRQLTPPGRSPTGIRRATAMGDGGFLAARYGAAGRPLNVAYGRLLASDESAFVTGAELAVDVVLRPVDEPALRSGRMAITTATDAGAGRRAPGGEAVAARGVGKHFAGVWCSATSTSKSARAQVVMLVARTAPGSRPSRHTCGLLAPDADDLFSTSSL